MLRFEICHRLKKAGFPQPDKNCSKTFPCCNIVYGFDDDGVSFDLPIKDWESEYIFCPQIEDLIRELGEDFEYLKRGEPITPPIQLFMAKSYRNAKIIICAETPESALANLYLELHEKISS